MASPSRCRGSSAPCGVLPCSTSRENTQTPARTATHLLPAPPHKGVPVLEAPYAVFCQPLPSCLDVPANQSESCADDLWSVLFAVRSRLKGEFALFWRIGRGVDAASQDASPEIAAKADVVTCGHQQGVENGDRLGKFGCPHDPRNRKPLTTRK
jgi:hypothetical protein